MDTSLDHARRLREEADALLFGRGIEALLKRYGDVIYAGSYALDLMAWPDIDLNLVVSKGKDFASIAAKLASEFIQWKEAVRVKFERNLHLRFPDLPVGLYLGVKLDIGDWKIPWKLDIWIVDESEGCKTEEKTKEIRKLLSPEKREKILMWKERLMTPEGRTPSFSGYWLYRALLVLELEEEKEILAYLRKKGVAV
jgi:hypothetical protein